MLSKILLAVCLFATLINCQPQNGWGDWSACPVTCGGGEQTRIFYENGTMTNGQKGSCKVVACDDPYSGAQWSTCTEECDGGTRTRVSANGTEEQTIPCNEFSCDAVTGDCTADIVIVIDSSASIGEMNWWRTKQSAADLVQGLKVNSNQTRVGIIMFSTEAKRELDLVGDKDQIIETIWQMEFMAGVTSTSDAILEMIALFQEQGRTNVAHIGVILTDGIPTINAEDAIPSATQAKAAWIQLVVVGITDDIDEDLIRDMATSNSSAFFANDFDELQQITNLIIEQTCVKSTALGCEMLITCPCPCDTPCIETCTEICQQVDTDLNIVIGEYEQQCTVDGNPDNPRVAQACFEPCPDPDDCARCDYTKGQIWLPHENCHQFWVCEQDGQGGYRKHLMTCGHQFWSQSLKTCVEAEPYENCGDPVPYLHISTTKGPCPYEPDPVNPANFRSIADQTHVQHCRPGFLFVADDICTCVRDNEFNRTCEDDKLLYFPFDVDFNDITCNRAIGVACGDGELYIGYDNQRGKALYLGGGRFLEVAFMRNYFTNNSVDAFSIALWMKADVTQSAGLVNNGDCENGASFEVNLQPAGVYGGIATEAGQHILSPSAIVAGQWHAVVWVYDGEKLELYLDGNMLSSGPISGFMLSPDVPMYIGFLDGLYYRGWIDDLTVWTRVLSTAEINDFSITAP